MTYGLSHEADPALAAVWKANGWWDDQSLQARIDQCFERATIRAIRAEWL